MVRLTEDMIVARTRVRFTLQDISSCISINFTNIVQYVLGKMIIILYNRWATWTTLRSSTVGVQSSRTSPYWGFFWNQHSRTKCIALILPLKQKSEWPLVSGNLATWKFFLSGDWAFLQIPKNSILWLTDCLLFKDSKTAKSKLFFQNLTGQGYSPESAPAKVGQFLQFSQEPPARFFLRRPENTFPLSNFVLSLTLATFDPVNGDSSRISF